MSHEKLKGKESDEVRGNRTYLYLQRLARVPRNNIQPGQQLVSARWDVGEVQR
jgi:hypothetical protein